MSVMLLMGAGRQRLADFEPVIVIGTDTRRVENDAKDFDGANWNPEEGQVSVGPGGKNARVRFSTHDSGDVPAVGSQYTGVTLRITLGNGDNQNYTFDIYEFTTGGDLGGVLTLALLSAGVVIRDDGTEKSVSLPRPTGWSTTNPQNNGLHFVLAAGPGSPGIITCSLDLNGIDFYIDAAWST